MNWIKKHAVTLLLVLALAVGLSLLLYPTVSDQWNRLHQSRMINTYARTVANLEQDEYADLLRAAQDYNAALAETGIRWKLTDADLAQYAQQLNVTGTGSMGYLTIPKLDVELSICHGTDTKTLETSVGHLEGTSLPVGGAGSHCVLSGHRGLPSARLFTDLDKLAAGDTFLLHVLDQTLTYEVDQIRVVTPDDLTELAIVPGEDYCTLVTCTPYGVNTHRLLVRGHRIDNAPEARRIAADALQVEPTLVAPVIGTVIALLLVAAVLLRTRKKTEK